VSISALIDQQDYRMIFTIKWSWWLISLPPHLVGPTHTIFWHSAAAEDPAEENGHGSYPDARVRNAGGASKLGAVQSSFRSSPTSDDLFAGDKGMNTKAHDVDTPEACSGSSPWKPDPR
jgi:hypothetical protein